MRVLLFAALSILILTPARAEKCKLKCRRYKRKRSMPGNAILSGLTKDH